MCSKKIQLIICLLFITYLTVCLCSEDKASTFDALLDLETNKIHEALNFGEIETYSDECDCGVQSTACTFEGGRKICSCKDRYSQKGDTCQYCFCGINKAAINNCSFFEDGKVNCDCKSGFVPSKSSWEGECVEACNSTNPCVNGGYCDDGACICRDGTNYPHCERVKECVNSEDEDKKCGDEECVFDQDLGKAVCRCTKTNLVFDEYDKKCKECFCGENEKCFFFKGEKRCDCSEGYFPANGTCKNCYCGAWSWGCSVSEDSKITCDCMNGYSQNGSICEECVCGLGGVCSFQRGHKVCQCRSGYTSSIEGCTKCDCGNEAEKCAFEESGNKTCVCKNGFEVQNGICFDIDECADAERCEESSTVCVNTLGSYECVCKDGYQKNGTNGTTAEICEDIDECLDNSSCPIPSSTVCVNYPGGYECHCKVGMESTMNDYDDKYNSPKYSGCVHFETVSWKSLAIASLAILGTLIVVSGILMYISKRRR